MKKIFLALLYIPTLMAAEVNLDKSSFEWSANKITGDGHKGTIKMEKAQLKEERGKIVGAEFVADINSIDVTDLSGIWRDKFISHMKHADFFEVEKYPTAKLVITKIKDTKIYGALTIKGKTHGVEMLFQKVGNRYSGELVFDRTKFDMVYGSGNFFKNLGDKVIKDMVRLKVILVIE